MKPNILFMIAEDICPNLGCYGDIDAITPNLDELAEKGMRYEHASSVGPVCSAARTAIALGMYPTVAGVSNHRSHVKIPDHIRIFAEFMQEAGYYTGINKTDYNFCETYTDGKITGWDTIIESDFGSDSEKVVKELKHAWNRRTEGKPFFFMHTYAVTHQSKYGYPGTPKEHRRQIIPRTKPEHYRDRNNLHIPRYHVDNPNTKEIWGQYHECITAMDRMIGETIYEMKEDGIFNNTIIFFFGDNGMGIPGGKSNIWNEGTNVPLIIHIPEKFKSHAKNYVSGKVIKYPVDFVDFASTILRLGNAKCPAYLQGRDILNMDESKARNSSFSYRNRTDNSCDISRTIKDDRYLYVRNFYPSRGWSESPYMVLCAPYFMASNETDVKNHYIKDGAYDRRNAFYLPEKPCEELYDLKTDPFQMNNLVDSKAFKDQLVVMRQLLKKWMIDIKDGGLLMEREYQCLPNGKTAYDMIQDPNIYPLVNILNICDMMFDEDVNKKELIAGLENENPSIRYWTIQVLYKLPLLDEEIIDHLILKLHDISPMVRISVAELLIGVSTRQDIICIAENTINGFLGDDEDLLMQLEALLCIDRIGHQLKHLLPKIEEIMSLFKGNSGIDLSRYIGSVQSLAKFMYGKWNNGFGSLDIDCEEIRRYAIFHELKENANAIDLEIG
ncbi:sulfatase-like hydrolase/transferase [Vallitalea pronyensis]|uniref:Sulfatase-like hydrolase/transferase n=1 Tax=Vallitalea pronyensis TaxID=1348613 RepID=A0A8J8MH88_9FIRM|nr:sulfatase-like hydrolase/transferase [Vallitalea pronyensis]QUI21605.1 sulfatase-like hydrolase/transferase [Vallitalea pronyensis]